MKIPPMPGLTRRQLDALIEQGPAHLGPIWAVVRDHGVTFAFVDQGGRPFRLPTTSGPTITLIGDDTEAAHGPAGFDGPSLQDALKRAQAAIVIGCAALPRFYRLAALAAALRLHVVIIETRPEQEIPWIALIQSECSTIPILVGTIKGGRA